MNLDNSLSGEGILDNIVKKCSGRIKFLYRQARSFPRSLKKTLCQSLVQSHLDYAISSWYAAMTQKAKNKLHILQNKMIRFTLDLGPRTHITEEHIYFTWIYLECLEATPHSRGGPPLLADLASLYSRSTWSGTEFDDLAPA